MIASILKSNEEQIKNTLNLIQKAGSRKVGMFGLSFKPGTDDLRESPLVSLVELLIGKGYDVKIHDPNVSLAKVMGSNKEYIERVIPHISKLLFEDVNEVMQHGETLVFGHNSELYRSLRAKLKPEQTVIDLVGCGPITATWAPAITASAGDRSFLAGRENFRRRNKRCRSGAGTSSKISNSNLAIDLEYWISDAGRGNRSSRLKIKGCGLTG